MNELLTWLLQTGTWLGDYLAKHKEVFHVGGEIVAVASLLHTFLPPWDWKPNFVTVGLIEFPSAQKMFYAVFNNRWYRLLVYTVGFIALNARSTVWRSISVNNPTGPNANKPATVVETVTAEKVIIPSEGGH